MLSQPDLPHQTVAGRLHLALGNWMEEAPGRGVVWLPIDIVIDDRNVLVPDLAWVSEEKVPPPGTRLLPVSPDLLVEVRSPSTWHRDIGVKRDLYARHGVRELWLVRERMPGQRRRERRAPVHRRDLSSSRFFGVNAESFSTVMLSIGLPPSHR